MILLNTEKAHTKNQLDRQKLPQAVQDIAWKAQLRLYKQI